MKYRLQKYSCGDYQAGYPDSISVVSVHDDLGEARSALLAEKVEGAYISWVHYELVEVLEINDGRRL